MIYPLLLFNKNNTRRNPLQTIANHLTSLCLQAIKFNM